MSKKLSAREVQRVMIETLGEGSTAALLQTLHMNAVDSAAIAFFEREIPVQLFSNAVKQTITPQSVLATVGEHAQTEEALRRALADAEPGPDLSSGGPFMAMVASVVRWARKVTQEAYQVNAPSSRTVH